MAAIPSGVTPETLITIKIAIDSSTKKLKLPLKDLTATALPAKLRSCLSIAPDHLTVFERYSDSVGGYITLDPANVAVFKALNRAAKAKGKLRLRATVIPPEVEEEQAQTQDTAPVVATLAAEQIMMPQTQSIGSGIFQYRDTRAAVQRQLEEAPVPQPFVAQASVVSSPPLPFPRPTAEVVREDTLKARHELAFRPREPAACTAGSFCAWSVYCNSCDAAMADAHYHCSICDGGDYDLCEACVAGGKTCEGEGHWLIKRFIKNGRVITSTTERVARRSIEIGDKVPGAFQQHECTMVTAPAAPLQEIETNAPTIAPQLTRTCNSCVCIAPEAAFVTCKHCPDYDICFKCCAKNDHGHHPGHEFAAAVPGTCLPWSIQPRLKPGRGVEHNAFCDGCDKRIFGVRHKCLNCPDWDYCSECVKKSSTIHPRHRFAALFEPIKEARINNVRHEGIYCDGPLCSKHTNQTYITGVRYKCAVCHDTDFCAACEATPGNHHNPTHPLIKFTTPVRNVTISTINEDARGFVRNVGDRHAETAKPAPVAPAPVQTVAEIAPTEEKVVHKAAQPFDGDVYSSRERTVVPPAMLNAEFVRDSVPDGSIMAPGVRFVQVWTLRNNGPFAWPAGCSIRYVGGDNMLNVDNGRPSSVASINQAVESSICGREVVPGEEVAFTITLKAPLREGKSISYWRLKSADGTPFGHRLWCDIDVRGVAEGSAPPVLPFMLNSTRKVTPSGAEPRPQPRCSRPTRQIGLDDQSQARLEALKSRIMQSRAELIRAGAARIRNPVQPSGPTPVAAAEPEAVHKPELQEQKCVVLESAPAAVKTEVPEEAESTSSSLMIFPKLDKESPAGSLLDLSKAKVATVENEDGEIEDAAVPQSPLTELEPTSAEQLDDFDDIEVLSISAHSDEDDGFLTDEEYDILDASDRETVSSP